MCELFHTGDFPGARVLSLRADVGHTADARRFCNGYAAPWGNLRLASPLTEAGSPKSFCPFSGRPPSRRAADAGSAVARLPRVAVRGCDGFEVMGLAGVWPGRG